MFEDSLFASTARRNPRRGWAAVLSFGLQAVVLGIFVLIPLLYTDALPVSLHDVFVVTAPVSHAPMPKAPEPHHTRETASNFVDNQLVQPIQIPRETHRIVDTHQIATGGGDSTGPDIQGAIPFGDGRNDAITRVLSVTPRVAPSVNPPRTVVVSKGVIDGLLVHKVTPVYPPLARQGRIQGQVVMQAIIGRDGTIQNLQVLSGHPWLVKAAIDAVKQWRYRPYLLNNEPVDVETQITVNFTLGG